MSVTSNHEVINMCEVGRERKLTNASEHAKHLLRNRDSVATSCGKEAKEAARTSAPVEKRRRKRKKKSSDKEASNGDDAKDSERKERKKTKHKKKRSKSATAVADTATVSCQEAEAVKELEAVSMEQLDAAIMGEMDGKSSRTSLVSRQSAFVAVHIT